VRIEPASSQGTSGLSYSILEGSAIGLTVDNYSVSDVGAYAPGKVRVRFDVSVANQLPGVALVPSTLASTGLPAASLMLFPMLQTAQLTTGTVAVSQDGSILVNRSAHPVVLPSADWDGDGTARSLGFDFGADTACTAPAPGCTRWEALPPLASGETSPVRTVGFDLDPTVSGFRAWLLLRADLQSSGSVPPPPPPPPPGSEVPFGPFGLLDDDGNAAVLPGGNQPFTVTHDAYSPANIIFRVVSARANKLRLILALTGGAHDYYLTDGVFDRAKWEAKLATYNTTAIKEVIAEGVADGTIIGANVMDEPYVHAEPEEGGNTWGPAGTMTKARVDSLCADTKRIFPTLPVGVGHQHDLFEPTKSYRICDFIIDQYSARFGDVEAYRDAGLALGRRDGHGILFSINILNGGPQAADVSAWLCPSTSGGRGQYPPNCSMTAEQIRDWALTLAPAGCGGLLMWRYDDEYMARPDNQAAFRDVATRLAALPYRPCARR
jgi:hypothetical protein